MTLKWSVTQTASSLFPLRLSPETSRVPALTPGRLYGSSDQGTDLAKNLLGWKSGFPDGPVPYSACCRAAAILLLAWRRMQEGAWESCTAPLRLFAGQKRNCCLKYRCWGTLTFKFNHQVLLAIATSGLTQKGGWHNIYSFFLFD